jgi:hypothetical protein
MQLIVMILTTCSIEPELCSLNCNQAAGWMICSLNSGMDEIVSFLYNIQPDSGALPASCLMGNGVLSKG